MTPHTDDLAQYFWQYVTTKAGLPRHLKHKAWRALRRSPEAVQWRFTLEQAVYAGHDIDPLVTTVHPAAMIGCIEACVRRKSLTRRDANTIQEAMLALVTREGEWRQARPRDMSVESDRGI